MRASCVISALLTVTFAIYANTVTAAYFIPLGTLSGAGGESMALGVSADGSVVVGESITDQEAFRWTSSGGMVGLGRLPGASLGSLAYDVSADGSVIVGHQTLALGSSFSAEGFRWTSSGGMVGLGDLPGGRFVSSAYGVSADGSVVVGRGESVLGVEAFRWSSSGGIVGLGDLPGGIFLSIAEDVSADGSVVVGRGESALGVEAFRWTSSGGMVGLGDLAGGNFFSEALDVSADGSVVVGRGESALGIEAFRWTSSGGMVGLGDLAGGNFSSKAFAVSADGSVVVGESNSASGGEAFRWTSSSGMLSVASMLTASGIDLTGWRLGTAIGVSSDGNTIVGVGWNPDGVREAWVANINALVTVRIDIKPSRKPGKPNEIDLKKDRNLKVAIIGSADFLALQVDPSTVKFGLTGVEASPTRFKGQDYNRDGFPDLVLTFKLKETGIDCGDTEATLTGQTFPDPVKEIIGTDTFIVEPCP